MRIIICVVSMLPTSAKEALKCIFWGHDSESLKKVRKMTSTFSCFCCCCCCCCHGRIFRCLNLTNWKLIFKYVLSLWISIPITSSSTIELIFHAIVLLLFYSSHRQRIQLFKWYYLRPFTTISFFFSEIPRNLLNEVRATNCCEDVLQD